MKKSRLFMLISVMTIVMSEKSFSMNEDELKSSPSTPKIQKDLVRLAPRPTRMVVEAEKIPDNLYYKKEELKYDKSRNMYYYGKNLDEVENFHKEVPVQ